MCGGLPSIARYTTGGKRVQPDKITALIQKESGFSGRSEGPSIASMEPFVELADLPLPALTEGQVLVKMRMASINPSDLHFIKGEYGQPRIKGKPAGFEGVGEVIAGKGARAEALVGKRVAFVATPDGSGTWADHAITQAASCIPVRPDMRDEDAAGHIVNPLTAMAMFDIVRKAGAKSFVMTAAGSQLCKLMTALGREHGIAPVSIIRTAAQADHLKALGAEEVLVTSDPDFRGQFAAMSKALKPRFLIDAVADQTSSDMFYAMPNGTRWVIYGKLNPAPVTMQELGQFVFAGKQIEGFWLTKWFATTPIEEQVKVIAEVQERFVSGKWQTEVAATIPLAGAIDKLPAALMSPGAKVMLVP